MVPPQRSPALRFLHRLLREASDLEKEMTKLQQRVREEQGIIEEGIRRNREEKEARVKQWGKVSSASLGRPEENIFEDQEEEITRLQQQVKSLQDKKEAQRRGKRNQGREEAGNE